MVNHVTVSVPQELMQEARRKGINVSLACQHGIRITLGLKCPIKEPCKHYKKSEMLQELLLKMEVNYLNIEDKYKRQRDDAWTIRETGR